MSFSSFMRLINLIDTLPCSYPASELNWEDPLMTTILWTDNWEAACAQAGQEHQLVLLDFFSPT
jgi:hypothetical protein